jgi:hypothetical protein
VGSAVDVAAPVAAECGAESAVDDAAPPGELRLLGVHTKGPSGYSVAVGGGGGVGN